MYSLQFRKYVLTTVVIVAIAFAGAGELHADVIVVLGPTFNGVANLHTDVRR